MKDRRLLVFGGAVLFALGFAAGYAARSDGVVATWAAAGEASAPDASAGEESAPQDELGDPESASPRAAPPARAGAGEAAVATRPGDVAVIGSEARGESARAGASEAASGGSGEPPALDGGARPTGRLGASAIRDVVRSHRDQLGFCFAWQLHLHPELRGRITMDFTIGEDGSVTRAEVADDQLGDETVLTCFRNVTRRMQFPAPEGGEVRVRYPFILAPEEPSDE
ncbi:MAG: AgmX/PglI C-terminal domain-containing protein [Sandaracinaceae bacterium]|nr:AgmX/PglI C-terminal domain-containing protein [Sandaracinaceae bacterium]